MKTCLLVQIVVITSLSHPKKCFAAYRRNCKGNPNCLVGIGEQSWLGEIDENAFHNVDDPNSERRDKVRWIIYLHLK